MKVNPLTGGTSFGGREGRKARRKQAIKSKKIGDRLLGTRRSEQTQLVIKGGVMKEVRRENEVHLLGK
jgi:hypothetical protein|tara:strand:+ start:779 stop:982 length:204 start_codon:yes stop_codon:yes gene_type:complete